MVLGQLRMGARQAKNAPLVVRINDDDADDSDDDADDNAWKDWTILDDQLGGWTLCAHKADDWVQFQGRTTTNYY